MFQNFIVSSQYLEMLPKLFVFDLDNCVWFPEMYQLWGGGSPFREGKNGDLADCSGERVYLMGDVSVEIEILVSKLTRF